MMDVSIIRGIIKTFDKIKRTFTAVGRVDELLIGRRFQQYGYYSNPPLEKTETLNIIYGNNVISIAENTGENLATADEDICVGINNTVKIYIKKADNSIVIKGGIVLIDSDHVELGGTTGLKKLATEDFCKMLFDLHVHTGGTISGSTGAPTFLTATVPTALTSKTEAE
jgi:hypothetical protein